MPADPGHRHHNQTSNYPKRHLLPALMADEEPSSNYEAFRECLSGPIIQKSALAPSKARKRKAHKARRKSTDQTTIEPHDGLDERNGSDAEDLADFIDVRPPSFPSTPLSVVCHSLTFPRL